MMSNVPKLRFKEFSGVWEEKNGNLLFETITNKKHNSDLPVLAITQEHGAIPRDMIDFKISVSNASVATYKIVEVGDFIISLRSFQGGIEYSNYKGICSPAYIILRPSIELDDSFYKHYFKTIRYIKKLNRHLEGIRDGKMVSFKQFSEIKLPFPSKQEQEKIASFLTSVDTKIEQLTKKEELLSSYKKGVMQKIFSGEIRFSPKGTSSQAQGDADDGSEFAPWEEKKLGEVFKQRAERDVGKLELLSVTINDGVKRRIDIEGKDNSSQDKSKYLKVCIDDIVYNSMRMWQGASGVSPYEGIVSPAYTVLKGNNQNSSTYFGYLFKTKKMIQIFQRNSQGLTSDTWNLKYPQLSLIKINMPSLEEQTKIANFLSSVDSKIEQVQKQLNSTKEFKKALLQQMFV